MMRKIFFIMVFFLLPFLLCFFTNPIYHFLKDTLKVDFENFRYWDSWISDYLTIGSFMFAVQSFLIPFLKKSLYDSKEYKDYIKDEYPEHYDDEQYRPLCNLSNFLFISTLLSFISALFMFVFVFVRAPFIINLTIYCGVLSFASLIISLFLMQQNFTIMFKNRKNIL